MTFSSILCVGGIGHRPDRLDENQIAVERELKRLLDVIREAATRIGPCRMRGVTSLAEGADRLFGRAAVAAGYEMTCVLPFSQSRFEQDFAGSSFEHPGHDSVQEFRDLLESARRASGLSVLELDGEAYPASQQYQPAARTVLNQSDVLVVVWDGSRDGAAGGTFETLREAISASTPAIWIHSGSPSQWRLLQRVPELLRPPEPADVNSLMSLIEGLVGFSEADQVRVANYLSEDCKRTSPRLWKWFCEIVSFSRRKQSENAEMRTDRAPHQGSETPTYAWLDQHITPLFKRADALANLYGDRYRSSFLRNYVLGFLAVCLALLPIGAGWTLAEDSVLVIGCAVVELWAVGLIFATVYREKRHQWHQRWLEYRLLAELLRLQYIQLPLGMWRSTISRPAHMSVYGAAEGTWMHRYVRSIVRSIGVPQVRIGAEYLTECAHVLENVVSSQSRFHGRNAHLNELVESRLHSLVVTFSFLTATLVFVHLLEMLLHWNVSGEENHVTHWLAIACAVFPALGATLHAISTQGEFVRVAKRSAAMKVRFEELQVTIAECIRPDRSANLSELQEMAHDASQMMIAEVHDWRVMFLDRPLLMHA